MKKKLVLVVLMLLSAAGIEAAFDRYVPDTDQASRINAEGRATLHGWAMEARKFEGVLDLDFPLDRGLEIDTPVRAQARIRLQLDDLKSVRNGKHFSDRMDNQMYATLNKDEYPGIEYVLDQAVLKSVPASSGQPFGFITRGRLSVAGQTVEIRMPVELQVLDGGLLRISGTAALKMSDFGIEPPRMAVVKVADEVEISFEWFVKPED